MNFGQLRQLRQLRSPIDSFLSSAQRSGGDVWARLPPREQLLLCFTLAVMLLAAVWSAGVAPALDTLRRSASLHGRIDAELLNMRQLAAEAAVMQALPRVSVDESKKALELSVRQRPNSTAQLVIAGDRATVTLSNASAQSLTEWLANARSVARALPVEARLSLNAGRNDWSGTVVLALPPQ